jgi:hypothetical protein
MADTRNDRAETAHRHDDRDLIENAEDAPGGAGTSGGGIARDVASRDEAKRAIDPDAGVTGVQKSDKVQPFIPTRSDHEGAQS